MRLDSSSDKRCADLAWRAEIYTVDCKVQGYGFKRAKLSNFEHAMLYSLQRSNFSKISFTLYMSALSTVMTILVLLSPLVSFVTADHFFQSRLLLA